MLLAALLALLMTWTGMAEDEDSAHEFRQPGLLNPELANPPVFLDGTVSGVPPSVGLPSALQPEISGPQWLSFRWAEAPESSIRAKLGLHVKIRESVDLGERDESGENWLAKDEQLNQGPSGIAGALMWVDRVPETGHAEWQLNLGSIQLGADEFPLPGDDFEVSFKASDWPTLEVAVRTEHGAPIEGATVLLGLTLGSRREQLTELTDIDGLARFAPLPPQCAYRCEAKAPGYAARLSQEIIFSPTERHVRIILSLNPAVRVAGQVVSAQGGPAAACPVRLEVAGCILDVVANALGRFEFEAAEVGPARLTTRSAHEANISQSIVIEEGNPAYVLRLQRGWDVTGSVIGPAGEPVVGTPVLVEAGKYGSNGAHFSRRTTDTDERGQFRVGPMPEEPVDVTAVLFNVSTRVEVEAECQLAVPGRSVLRVPLVLKDSTTGLPITGIVRGSIKSGSTISGSSVKRVDAAGRVTVSGMAATDSVAQVLIASAGYESVSVAVPGGDHVQPMEVSLHRSEDTYLVSSTIDGVAVSDVHVRLTWPASELVGEVPLKDMAYTSGQSPSDAHQAMLSGSTNADGLWLLDNTLPTSTQYLATRDGYYPSAGGIDKIRTGPVVIQLQPVGSSW
ncbi:MAG: carboxypeptidase-like regulatory domain-containing protein [Planctomycetota bacterium]